MVPGRWMARGVMRAAARAMTLAAVLAMAACGGGGGSPSAAPALSNRAPTFTSPPAISVPENTSGVFFTVTATDPDNNALTYSISGGPDAARLRISTGGALTFVTPPDFENPADASRDNVYQITVGVSDGSLSTTQSLAITVTDVVGSTFRVRRVVTGLDMPVFLAPVPDGSGRVFVVQLPGRIVILTPSTGQVAATPFLDVTTQVSTDGERGLLGFATAPDFATSGTFYVYLTAPDGTIEVRRYRTVAGDPNRADPASADAILRIAHPRNNHNGGWIGFGPDGLLYIATGDGGGSGDPDNNGQNTNTLLGKILRIDPSSDGFPGDPNRDYAIPAGNPYVSGGGAQEVLAYGLRNPFRCSFDPQTGDLWIGDVGQGTIEEIDRFQPGNGGANYGWPIMEGTVPFRGGPTTGLTPPVAEYRHGTGTREGSTVIGGHVYRGPVESLQGLYLFADFIQPNLWSFPLTAIVPGATLPSAQFTVRNADFAPDAGVYTNIVSFGVDQSGQVYIVDLNGDIFVIEAVPGGAPAAGAGGAPPALRGRGPPGAGAGVGGGGRRR